MRHAIAIAAIALIPATGFAGDTKPVGNNGLTVGPDGKMWRMEGCAAYPVEAHAGAQSKPVAAVSTPVAPDDEQKLAKSEDKASE